MHTDESDREKILELELDLNGMQTIEMTSLRTANDEFSERAGSNAIESMSQVVATRRYGRNFKISLVAPVDLNCLGDNFSNRTNKVVCRTSDRSANEIESRALRNGAASDQRTNC